MKVNILQKYIDRIRQNFQKSFGTQKIYYFSLIFINNTKFSIEVSKIDFVNHIRKWILMLVDFFLSVFFIHLLCK